MARKPRKKPFKKKIAVKHEDDASRLTDKYGRLKFFKTSDYIKTVTQGEG